MRQLAKETTALKDIFEDSQSCFHLAVATFQLLAVGSKLAEMDASGREVVWKFLQKQPIQGGALGKVADFDAHLVAASNSMQTSSHEGSHALMARLASIQPSDH